MLAIFPDLNIFIWIITVLISFRNAPWYSYFLSCARYLANLTGLSSYICLFVTRVMFFWFPLSRVSALYCYFKTIFLRYEWYSWGFDHLMLKFISIYAAWTHSDKQQNLLYHDGNFHGWVYYVDTTKIIILRFVWYHLVVIELIIKFIFVYPESIHSNEQQQHLISLN